MVPGGRPLIAIGYKYSAQKVLSFIFTDNSWITQSGLPCLSNYPDQFSNFSIFPVACPLVMSKFFSLLMRLTPTTNQGSLICHWRSYWLPSGVGGGYVQQLLL